MALCKKHPCNDEASLHQSKGVLLCDKIAFSQVGFGEGMLFGTKSVPSPTFSVRTAVPGA